MHAFTKESKGHSRPLKKISWAKSKFKTRYGSAHTGLHVIDPRALTRLRIRAQKTMLWRWAAAALAAAAAPRAAGARDGYLFVTNRLDEVLVAIAQLKHVDPRANATLVADRAGTALQDVCAARSGCVPEHPVDISAKIKANRRDAGRRRRDARRARVARGGARRRGTLEAPQKIAEPSKHR